MTADMIRVIVVDDSNFMVNVIKNILESDKGIRVIGTAKSGAEAIEKIKELKPDVVTLDVLMPGMNGLEALREIMRDCPTRVVMISAADKESADIVIRSLEEGAADFISKPQGPISPHMKRISSKIIDKVKTASSVDIEKLKNRKRREKKAHVKRIYGKSDAGVAIGASLGGISSIEKVLIPIKDSKASFFVVQHMLPEFVSSFAERLDSILNLKVKVAENGEMVKGGIVYIAPGGYHMKVINKRVVLEKGERVNGVMPSADVLMESVADEYGGKAIGIVLSGMGHDGSAGLKKIHDKRGLTIAESPESSTIFGMPNSAVESGCTDLVLDAGAIAHGVIETTEKLEK